MAWKYFKVKTWKLYFDNLKAHIHPKYIALRAQQIWISCDTKLSKNFHVPNLMQMRKIYCFHSFALDSAHVKFDVWNGPKICYHRLFSLQSDPAHILFLIRLCKYVPCLSFYSFPVLFCIYSVTFRCIFVKLVVWSWRGQDEMAPFFEQLVCVQPIRSRI